MKLVIVIVTLFLLIANLSAEDDRICDDEEHVCVPRENCDFYQQNLVNISKLTIVAEVGFLRSVENYNQLMIN